MKDTRICDYIDKYIKETLLAPFLSGELLKHNLDPVKTMPKEELQSFVDKYNWRLIHIAVERGRLDIVKFLIEQDIFKADLKDENNYTPVHNIAAGLGHVDIFKYLVQECKCEPMCKISDDPTDIFFSGATTLHLAARYGHFLMVKHILESDYPGIDADVETNIGTTPLQFATMEGRLDIVKYLIKKHNCNPSHRDRRKVTAIHCAAYNFHLNVLRFLIEEIKCDPKVCDEVGASAIHIAAWRGSLDIVKYLVSKCDINPNCQTASAYSLYSTPLHYAAFGGHLHIVKYLTKLPNCEVHCQTTAKMTPLSMAAAHGHYEVVKYLSQQYDNSNFKLDIFGNAPLHAAARNGHFEVVKFLCKKMGTSPAIKNYDNQTPLHFALWNGHDKVALYLIVLLYFECQDSY